MVTFIQTQTSPRVIESLSDVRRYLQEIQTEVVFESGSSAHHNPDSLKYIVGNKIIHLLTEAKDCGIIDRSFPIGVWTNPEIRKVDINGLAFIYDIKAFGFLIADESVFTKQKLLDQLDAIIGPLNGMHYNNILQARSQQEFLRIYGED